jgi:uncharacterized protein YhhL (DUF1145 family)
VGGCGDSGFTPFPRKIDLNIFLKVLESIVEVIQGTNIELMESNISNSSSSSSSESIIVS